MTITTDTARFSLVEETLAGQTPSNPVFEVIRLTSESISFAYETTNSEELGGVGRGVRDSILTGGSVSGAISFELHQSGWLETLMSAVLGSDWGNDPLAIPITADEAYVSDSRRTFTLEKDWVDGAGDHLYHWYRGNVADTMTLTIVPNTPITGDFGLVGMNFDYSETPIVGATYTAADSSPIMTAPLVSGIVLKDSMGTTIFDVGTHCWTNLVINLTNNSRGIACIGTLGSKDVALGRFEGTIDYSIYFESNAMLQLLKDQEQVSLQVTCVDSEGGSYVFDFPKLKVNTGEVVASGVGEDVLVEGQMTVLTGDAPTLYGLKITRVDAPVAAAASKPKQTKKPETQE